MMSPGFTTNTRTTENPFSLLHENLAPGAARLLLLLAAGVLIFVLPVRGQQPPSLFSSTELSVAPSPANARRLALEPGERVARTSRLLRCMRPFLQHKRMSQRQ
jgi:hypothetical protein